MKYEDDEVYAVEESASGGNAMYLDYCDVAWHRPSYAACLKKIADRKEGRLDSRFAACSAAIGRKACPAMKLKAEEAAAGQAIYYINRAKLNAYSQYKQEMDGVALGSILDGDSAKRGKRAAKKQEAMTASKPVVDTLPEDGYAAAINAAMKNSMKPEVKASNDEVVKSAPTVSATSGMSLLEIARLKLNCKG